VSIRRRVLLDVSPLRDSRDFRLLWFGQAISIIGRQVTVVAVPVQVFDQTGSSFAVGMVSLVQLAPLIVGSLWGGAVADAVDRRKLLLVAQVLLALTSVGLAVNASLPDPALWPIFVLTALSAGVSGIDSPTRQAALPRLVRRDRFPAAAALNQTMFQSGQVVGPALGGLLIARVGLAAAYWVDVATFGAAVVAILAMRPLPPEGGGTRPGLKSIAEGLRYLRGKRAVQGAFVIDIDAMVFGMPRALFPALGQNVYGGGAGVVGLLYAAPAAGALVGALTTGWINVIQRQGRAVLVSVAVWGAAIAAFGITPWLAPALVLLAIAGAADVVSAVFRNTILQLSVPDRLRGRLSAVNIAVVTGGPRLGDAEAGAVAALTTTRISVVSGGLACVAGVAVIGRLIPELGAWRLDRHAVDDGAAPSGAPQPGAAPSGALHPDAPGGSVGPHTPREPGEPG
jgi:MFS family permease